MVNKPKRIIRSIWNGPFHIGPLASPVSVGDVLLKVLQTAWRAIVLSALVLLLLVALVLGAVAWEDHLKDKFFPPLETVVSAEVRHYSDPGISRILENADGTANVAFPCMNEYPLSVTFSNGSDRPVGRLAFAIRAYVPGRTSNVLIGAEELEAAAIILPGHKWQTCFSAHSDTQMAMGQLVYVAKIIEVEEADPALVKSAPLPLIDRRSDGGTGSTAGTKFVDQVWEAFQAMLGFAIGILTIILMIISFGYGGYCFSAVVSWITRGRIKVAQTGWAVFLWAYILGIPVTVILASALGSAPQWLEWPTEQILNASLAVGVSADLAAGMSVWVVLLSPLLMPIILHFILRAAGANVAALWPFRSRSMDLDREDRWVGDADARDSTL